MRCDEPRLVLTSLTTTHQGTRGKGIFCEGGWRGKGERAKVDIEVDPQRRRFGRRESNFALQFLIEGRAGKTELVRVVLRFWPMAVKCASLIRWSFLLSSSLIHSLPYR
jgi:hypothetical protein